VTTICTGSALIAKTDHHLALIIEKVDLADIELIVIQTRVAIHAITRLGNNLAIDKKSGICLAHDTS
jgi:putative intracellular protease/amidase